jgi:hypothetical protein
VADVTEKVVGDPRALVPPEIAATMVIFVPGFPGALPRPKFSPYPLGSFVFMQTRPVDE